MTYSYSELLLSNKKKLLIHAIIINLKCIMHMKEVELKRLHVVRFHSYDILEKENHKDKK